jgi:2-keto-4-pentenoate hydratase/2-oxohepta-3-ene-1,7-dioic acid hydratase in catechol pathway
MKFIRFVAAPGDVKVGVLDEATDTIRVVDGASDLLPLVRAGRTALHEAGATALRSGEAIERDSVRALSPLATPPTLRDFYAFEQHVKAGRASRGLEMDPDWYELPVFYFSNPYATIGCGDVPMAPGTQRFDFELEVAAVLGGGGRDLTSAEGEDTVIGYCVLNDFSARDIQHREMRLSMGPVKGKDTATALGPYLVTKDELADFRAGNGYELTMACHVNGRRYSEAVWSDVYWSFGEMVAYASRGTEVRPGDVIGSGTCGTGCILELSRTHGADEYPWLVPGDEVVASIEQLGVLTNTVVQGSPSVPLRSAEDRT